MPTYDYHCDRCGDFIATRPIAERDTACGCPTCGLAARRTLSLPALALMPGNARASHIINERAAHAPRRSGESPHRHGPACGCGTGMKTPGATANELKGASGGRPWMISH
ncbi:FmdB family zinc ribbon protein [Paraburkholderia sp.]|uniref:FmdB family zinc ribbon protein n=1 Tax=Paraburkholderia sp. TaxID=1926495 RepID=UPI003D6E2AAE